ncbi:MAG TPA: YetF domain-containing protein [Pyrinomonadaceae bacterium]|nr:YetF domain-containing protein [Pyrinomonadaceae bacterium]
MFALPSWLWDQSFWDNAFRLHMADTGVSVLEKIFRTLVVYAALVFLLRVFGKRELAQLNPFDLVVLLLLSNSVQNAIIGADNTVVGGLLGACVLLLTNYLVVRFMFKHKRLDQILEGTPTVLIENGELCRDALARELLTESELMTMAHRQGFGGLEEIQTCTLEPGGVFFIQGKHPSSDETEYAALLARLDHISRQIEEIKRSQEKR